MSTQRNNPIAKAIRFALIGGAAIAAATPAFAADEAAGEEEEQRIEVTGSRIKRTDLEGALPVTVIDREQIDMSGDVSVADLLRNTTFNSFGSFRPQSGSSAQSFAEVSLRGLGGSRTLVLIDGRRAPKGATVGDSTDLNAIPLAAVERVEILTDGASAVYGSDAIGGVINVITRKDFNGVEAKFGFSNPKREGGDTEEGSIIFGTSSDKGNLLAGISMNKRDIVFARDREWSSGGASVYGNNWYDPNTGDLFAVDGGCTQPGFFLSAGLCLFDFTFVSADEASVDNAALFVRGEYQINDDWSTYINSSASHVESFGRYAPAPAFLFIGEDNPLNTFGQDMYVAHRYAALGNRDDTVKTLVTDLLVGVTGTIGNVEIDFGARTNKYDAGTTGRNYVVNPIAAQYASDGTYNFVNPLANDESVLNSMKATIRRESIFETDELYASAQFDLFEMGGGTAAMIVGAETRDETYQDQYDSLSEGGVIGGSSGNSAGGSRSVDAYYFEAILPVVDTVEVGVAGRYDSYSDYGSDFSPKVSVRFQPTEELTLRASYGKGFAAPSLPLLTQKPAFSADSVTDPGLCAFLGQAANCSSQVDALVISNPALDSESSTQFSVGVAWEPTDWINMSVDYWNIQIDDVIRSFSSNELIGRDRAGLPMPPGLSVTRQDNNSCQANGNPEPRTLPGGANNPNYGPDGVINSCDRVVEVVRGSSNEGDLETDGVDLNVRTKFDFGAAGSLSNNLQVGWAKSYEINGGDNLIGTYSTPEYRANLGNVWTIADFAVVWNVNYIHGYDDARSNPEEAIESWTTHDLQFVWNTPWNGQIAVGATNVTDEDPVLNDNETRGFDFNLYDGYGRITYARYTQSF